MPKRDQGAVVYNSSKAVYIIGPVLLVLVALLCAMQLYERNFYYFLVFSGFFILMLVLFSILSQRNRETVWENSASILYFPSPIPKRIHFDDVKIAFPLFSYSPQTKKMVTSKLCLIDHDGRLFRFNNIEAVTAIILGLAPRWKEIYVKDYDLQKILPREQLKMTLLLNFKNPTARASKFLTFILFGGLVLAVGYFVLRRDFDWYMLALALLVALVSYFCSIFLIGAILIMRENAKRNITRARDAGFHKKLDKGLLKLYLSSDVPDFDGEEDVFSEIAVEMKKRPKDQTRGSLSRSDLKSKRSSTEKKRAGRKKQKRPSA